MESLSLGKQADCERAWALLWEWSKRGRPEARIQLWAVVSLDWIRPPGLNQDYETGLRHSYTFLLYALAEDSEEAIAAVKRMPSDRRMSKFLAHGYLDCAASDHRRACVDGLVTAGRVASFQTYARELNILAAAPGAKPAHCPADAFHSPARKQ